MMLHVENPAWWLLSASLIPLVVHLVARAKPHRRKFSSITMLQELVKLQTRRARPKDWLLLLLRTLACACVAFAFLLPYWGNNAVESGSHTLMMVVDDTASMGAADGQHVRMNRACSVARAALNDLQPTDRVNLISLAGYPTQLFDAPECGKPLVLRELARMQSKPFSSAGVQEALLAAARQLSELPEGRTGELLIVSDFQQHTMQKPMEKLMQDFPGLRVRCVTVSQTPVVENTAVESLTLSPSKPLPGQDVTVTVALRHFAAESSAQTGDIVLNVTLSAGDLRLSQPCSLPRNGQGSVSFALTAPQHQKQWILEARTEPDAFPEDNCRYAVAPIAAKLECLAIAPDRAQLGFMLRVLEKTPFLSTLQLPALPESAADFIVWLAPTAEDIPAIRARLAAGACVMVIPDSVRDTACALLLTDSQATYAAERKIDGTYWKTEVAAKQDSVFALFEPSALRALGDAGVYCRLGGEFGQHFAPGCTVLLRYTDGVPAIVRRPVGKGALLVWNLPITDRDSRWGYSPLCLPVVAETLLKSRTDSEDGLAVEAGRDFLQYTVPGHADPTRIRLVNANGEELPTFIQQGGAAQVLRAENVACPGVYRWLCGDEELSAVAVNFPIEESELRAYTPEVGGEGVLTAERALDATNGSARVDLWPYLLGLALLFFISELLICRVPKMKRKTSQS